jgi:hypothetical protein
VAKVLRSFIVSPSAVISHGQSRGGEKTLAGLYGHEF